MDVRIRGFSDYVRASRPVLAYLCAPTSPRGEWVPAALLGELVSRNPDTRFVIDQSYLGMSRHALELNVAFPENAVLLRSVTKELGLPGVRAGFALMNAKLRALMQNQRPHWVLGSHAQAVLETYSSCHSLLAARRRSMLNHASILARDLAALDWQPNYQDTPYFTVQPPPESGLTVDQVAKTLVELHGVAIRDCASFGLPTHIRVVAHPRQHRFIAALADLGRA
jgi:histidinol-phosphate/aromatic aminotransferase/cobyric acid decarboxylase-like protein